MAEKRVIGPRQKALLHVAKAQLGLDDDTYRDLLRAEAGVESSNDLPPAGFDRVMKRLRRLGFRRRRVNRSRPDAGAVITRAQQTKIQQLYAELGWTAMDRQMGFNRRQISKAWPQTRADANKVVEGLKAILKREREGGGGRRGGGSDRAMAGRVDG